MNRFERSYGKELRDTLAEMLKVDEKDRPDWLYLKQFARKQSPLSERDEPAPIHEYREEPKLQQQPALQQSYNINSSPIRPAVHQTQYNSKPPLQHPNFQALPQTNNQFYRA